MEVKMSNEIWRILIAVAVAGHGIGHVFFLVPSLGLAKWGQSGHSWLLSRFGEAVVRPVGSLLWLLAIIGFVAAGFGIFDMQGWWRSLAIASAAISLLGITLFFDGLPFNPTINPVIFDVAVLVALLLARWPSASLIGS